MEKHNIASWLRRDLFRFAAGAAATVAAAGSASAQTAGKPVTMSKPEDVYDDADRNILGPNAQIQHITFMVDDIEKSTAWWEKMLDFKLYMRMQTPRMNFLRNGNVYVSFRDGSKLPRPAGPIKGYSYTSLVVPDADKARARLIARGWTKTSPGNSHPTPMDGTGGPDGLGEDFKATFFEDMDGNRFQFWSGYLAPGEVTGGVGSQIVKRY